MEKNRIYNDQKKVERRDGLRSREKKVERFRAWERRRCR